MKLQVNADDVIYIQPLIDCIWQDEIDQYLLLKVNNSDGESVIPLLPFKYKSNTVPKYKMQGYIFDLKKGDYIVTIKSYTYSEKLNIEWKPRVVDGRKWMVRAISEHISLQHTE